MFNRLSLAIGLGLSRLERIGLFYHAVSDRDLPHLKHYRIKDISQFEADLHFVKRCYRFLRYEEAKDAWRSAGRLPRPGFLLTFDDGFVECYEIVRPILKQFGVEGVFFVCTDFLDNRNMFYESKVSLCIGSIEALPEETVSEILHRFDVQRYEEAGSWLGTMRLARARIKRFPSAEHERVIRWLLSINHESEDILDRLGELLGLDFEKYLALHRPFLTSEQIRQMASEGFIIGAHGKRHEKLRNKDRNEMEKEILESCERIRGLTGRKKIPFAFAHSARGIGPEVCQGLLKRYDVIDMFFDTGGIRTDPPRILSRIWADSPPDGGEATNIPILVNKALRRYWSRKWRPR